MKGNYRLPTIGGLRVNEISQIAKLFLRREKLENSQHDVRVGHQQPTVTFSVDALTGAGFQSEASA